VHDILRHVGLLWLAGGVLRPTKAAGDEIETVRRLRTWFPPRKFDTLVAERAVALVAARGPLKVLDLAAEIFAMLGDGWRRGNDPITVTDVQHDLYRLAHQLAAVDMLAAISPAWTAGPSARSLLPGVALFADLV
jgi:hypothetical protein